MAKPKPRYKLKDPDITFDCASQPGGLQSVQRTVPSSLLEEEKEEPAGDLYQSAYGVRRLQFPPDDFDISDLPITLSQDTLAQRPPPLNVWSGKPNLEIECNQTVSPMRSSESSPIFK